MLELVQSVRVWNNKVVGKIGNGFPIIVMIIECPLPTVVKVDSLAYYDSFHGWAHLCKSYRNHFLVIV
jgi:hypothetical protein